MSNIMIRGNPMVKENSPDLYAHGRLSAKKTVHEPPRAPNKTTLHNCTLETLQI